VNLQKENIITLQDISGSSDKIIDFMISVAFEICKQKYLPFDSLQTNTVYDEKEGK
jgi:hypothetical protein